MKSLLPPELQHNWSVRDDVPRRERFRELAFAGYRIPRCGLFKDMKRLNVPLVVYTDELAHCGEGKVLWKPGDLDPDTSVRQPFASEYKPDMADHDGTDDDDDGLGTLTVSWRELVVGKFKFVIKYTTRNSWMSNVDGDYEITHHAPACRSADLLTYPMYAIDSTDCDDRFYHFDLNTCPGVPLEAVNLIGRDVLTASVREVCVEWGLIQ